MLLSNDRVRLRALEPEDLELLYRWENDPELWEVGNTLALYSRYILKEYIAGSDRSIYESRQLRFMIEDCDTGTSWGSWTYSILSRIRTGRLAVLCWIVSIKDVASLRKR